MKESEVKDRMDYLMGITEDDAIVLEPRELDEAIVGVDTNGCLVYSIEKLYLKFQMLHSWSMEDAIEWVQTNVVNVKTDDFYPVFIYEHDVKIPCSHKNAFYQPNEPENNVNESYSCDDCGEELEMPVYDPDLDRDNEFGSWLDMEKA